MKATKPISILFTCLLFFASCKSDKTAKDAKEPAATEEKTETGSTPITITSPTTGDMSETVELNAISSFLLKSYVKSSANGYLQVVDASLGKYVTKGQELFVLKTKEATSLGNTINALDSSLHFDGVIRIKSPGTGYITQINYRPGDYVQDNEQMAVITDTKSFVFLLDLPYELKPFLPGNKELDLKLPDGTILQGHVDMAMPTVDAASQTQSFIIRVNSDKQIPENLIAKVTLVKRSKSKTISLPKSAVLTDELQSQFWIMQMIDSATAVKVPVTKGLESADKVEILTPLLHATDKILMTGNYGLPDTAKVTINKQ
jgi:multidrug efflux pump subunit AcrA (membrane-fusion protein)